MFYFKDENNKVHAIEDIAFINLLPTSCVEISEEEAYALANPPKTLSELKDEKNAEINRARLESNQSTFTHGGKQVACDVLSRGDIEGINGYVATRDSLPASWVGGWKATDNSIIPIQDVAAWNEFYDSMIAEGQANFSHSQALKVQLAAATTAEEVAAIAW
jgi:hypothetical protein